MHRDVARDTVAQIIVILQYPKWKGLGEETFKNLFSLPLPPQEMVFLYAPEPIEFVQCRYL